MSASHCPSKETAESENCSNTESRNGNLHVKKKKKKNLKLFNLFYLTREHLTMFFVVLVHFLKV